MTAARGLLRGEAVERLVFGTSDTATIVRAVDGLCRSALGAGVAAELFVRTSVGTTIGVRLDDGRRVVVKAHQPRVSAGYLTAIVTVQRRLAAGGFPCPRPLAAPLRLGNGFATVEELVDDGDFRDTHDPSLRREIAGLLAKLLELTRPLGQPAALREAWTLWTAGSPWPETAHSPIFDFPATNSGAEWIDALAARAKARSAASEAPRLVAHTDWSGKHFRFDTDGGVTVVYDWDSVGVTSEIEAVAIAAATFTSNLELDVDDAPAPDEVAAFVDDYAAARKPALARRELRAMRAAAAYVLAYTARCEHALGIHGDFTAALGRHGDAYLDA